MLINWKKDRILVVPCLKDGVQIGKDLTLTPGVNNIPNDQWAMAREHVKDKIERGDLEEIKAEVSEKVTPVKVPVQNVQTGKNEEVTRNKVETEIKSAKTLKELPAKEAEALVKDTYNLKTLEEWAQDDPRDAVRAAIKNQIDAINEYGEDKLKKKEKDSKDK